MTVAPYRLISIGKQMGIGVTGSNQVTLSAVAKTNSTTAPYCVVNELICAELGRFLRLPIPPSGIVRPTTPSAPLYFASMDFNLTGNSLPPIEPATCVVAKPDVCTGLVLFDILIANCDRHRGNIAFDRTVKPPQMSVFDHSHALFGYEAGAAEARLRDLRDRLAISGGSRTRGNRHCLLDVLDRDDHFQDWMNRIHAVPDYLIDGLCDDAKDLGAAVEEADEAKSFLKYRRDAMKTIIDANRTEFRAIRQWSLL